MFFWQNNNLYFIMTYTNSHSHIARSMHRRYDELGLKRDYIAVCSRFCFDAYSDGLYWILITIENFDSVGIIMGYSNNYYSDAVGLKKVSSPKTVCSYALKTSKYARQVIKIIKRYNGVTITCPKNYYCYYKWEDNRPTWTGLWYNISNIFFLKNREKKIIQHWICLEIFFKTFN